MTSAKVCIKKIFFPNLKKIEILMSEVGGEIGVRGTVGGNFIKGRYLSQVLWIFSTWSCHVHLPPQKGNLNKSSEEKNYGHLKVRC